MKNEKEKSKKEKKKKGISVQRASNEKERLVLLVWFCLGWGGFGWFDTGSRIRVEASNGKKT